MRHYCYLNEEKRYVHVSIPKVACTSIRYAIGCQLGIFTTPTPEVKLNPLHLAMEAANISLEAAVSRTDCVRWSVVRHPAERLVSCWSMFAVGEGERIQEIDGLNFPSFIHKVCEMQYVGQCNEHYAPQVETLTHLGVPVVDEIYRLHEIDTWWPQLQERFGLPGLLHINSSEHRPWREYYTPELRRMVEWRYGADFHVGGYAW